MADNRDFTMFVGKPDASGAVLGVDTAPNTTEPAAGRSSSTPANTNGVMTLTADAGCTVEGHFFSKTMNKWVKLFSQALTAFVASVQTNVPANVPFTLVVTVNGGGAKVVSAMYGGSTNSP